MKIVFFGSIGLAKDCLENIVLKRNLDVVGVCCSQKPPSWRNEESVYDFAIKNQLKVLDLGDIPNLQPDLGISVRFNKIIPDDIIDCFKYGIVNTHGGILPMYRGTYCNINAIINGEKEFGVTLHYISSGIDTGDIIAIKKIALEDTDTGFSLYKKGEKLCYEILEENIDKIISLSNERISQIQLIEQGMSCHTYYSNVLKKKELKLEQLGNPETVNIIRAFDSPYHEPAFVYISGKKIYLKVSY